MSKVWAKSAARGKSCFKQQAKASGCGRMAVSLAAYSLNCVALTCRSMPGIA